MSSKRPESVLVVIFDENKRILALQRQDDPAFWQSVTGSMEGDESPLQTALREVKEEIGVNVALSQYCLFDTGVINQYEIRAEWLYRYPKGTRLNTEHVFLLQIESSEKIVLTEHVSYQWLKAEKAVEKMWSSTNKSAIQRYIIHSEQKESQVK